MAKTTPRESLSPPPRPLSVFPPSVLPPSGSGATALHSPGLHSVQMQRGHAKAALPSRAEGRRGQQLSGGEPLGRQLHPKRRRSCAPKEGEKGSFSTDNVLT